jgi:hypothetical protein
MKATDGGRLEPGAALGLAAAEVAAAAAAEKRDFAGVIVFREAPLCVLLCLVRWLLVADLYEHIEQ